MNDPAEPAAPDAPASPGAAPLGPEDVRFELRSGPGCVLLAALLLVAAAVAWRVSAMLQAPARAEPEPALEPCLVERETLVRAASRHDIPRLEPIHTLSVAEAQQAKIGRRGKFLVHGDLVLGVVVKDEACAYPLRFLQWHEAVWHELGGVPLLVTWSPLSGSAAVFDRRPRGPEGQEPRPRALVASGWLSNSGQLLVDEGAPGESLWSQLQARAVTGPAAAAGLVLDRIPAEVVRWEDWSARHPQTRVMTFDPPREKLYQREPYRNYEGSEEPRFPALPLPTTGPRLKAPVLAVQAGGVWRVYPIEWLERLADPSGACALEQAGVRLRFQVWRNAPELPPVARVEADAPLVALRCYWFAWHAARPDDATLGLEPPRPE
ncbi:MAG: DUF3179 domain-containing (seleno)protein [Planctomycetota bacterium]